MADVGFSVQNYDVRILSRMAFWELVHLVYYELHSDSWIYSTVLQVFGGGSTFGFEWWNMEVQW